MNNTKFCKQEEPVSRRDAQEVQPQRQQVQKSFGDGATSHAFYYTRAEPVGPFVHFSTLWACISQLTYTHSTEVFQMAMTQHNTTSINLKTQNNVVKLGRNRMENFCKHPT